MKLFSPIDPSETTKSPPAYSKLVNRGILFEITHVGRQARFSAVPRCRPEARRPNEETKLGDSNVQYRRDRPAEWTSRRLL